MRREWRQRKLRRLPEFDYAQPGAYFVTICVADRMPRFGRVVDASLHLNDAGHMILGYWRSLPARFPHVELDAFVLMPNHLHAIVGLNTAESTGTESLSAVIGAFKSLTTRAYAEGVREDRWPRFERHLWQQSFYDHVIRDSRDLDRVRAYIDDNPARWLEDIEYQAWQQILDQRSQSAHCDNPRSTP